MSRLSIALAALACLTVMVAASPWAEIDIQPLISDDYDPGWGPETSEEYH